MDGNELAINVIIGSCGLIGQHVSRKLAKSNDLNYFLDLHETADDPQHIKIDLVNYDHVNRFLDKLFQADENNLEINIIYLAARDAKLGEKWQKFEDFKPSLWEEYAVVNQTALLSFVSSAIRLFIQRSCFTSLQFILFPSMYNYLGPDQRAYTSWPNNLKPFEYIGTKSLTRDLNKYVNSTYGHLNIRSNCIIPHLVIGEDKAADQTLLLKTLTRRGTEALEIAQVVEFLIDSPKNLVGQEIFVDGGWMNQ